MVIAAPARGRVPAAHGGAVQADPIKTELKARMVSTIETKLW